MTTTPKTSYDILQMLDTYHARRRDTYDQLARRGSDERAVVLLEYLVRLEDDMLQIIRGEKERITPEQASRLMPGPTLTVKPAHAMDCQCDGEPTFDEALACALTSDEALDELIDHLQASSAASSLQDLATRLREAERMKDRQIAKFTRQD